MDIIDYFLFSNSSAEFLSTLIMLFGEETVFLAEQLSIIKINHQIAHLVIN